MTSKLIKPTLAALAFASLGLIATGAQADSNRGGPAYQQDTHHSRSMQVAHANPHSRTLMRQIDARQDRQMDRIQAGKRAGTLTRSEYRTLTHEQRRIRAMEQHFRADGHIDRHEFQRLDRALDRASRNIRNEKHDHQARTGYGHGYRFN